jgi:E3 ubiquitin-protein ligase HUWE1
MKVINDAFWAGETSVRVIAGRRKYNICFTTMIQTNEETGNDRPIMMCLKEDWIEERRAKRKKQKEEEGKKITNVDNTKEEEGKKKEDEGEKSPETMEVDSEPKIVAKVPAGPTNNNNGEQPVDVAHLTRPAMLPGFTEVEMTDLVSVVVPLLGCAVDSDSVNSMLRLLVRLTTGQDRALIFVRLGGVKHLSKIPKTDVHFAGSSTMVCLLVRHVFDSDSAVEHLMRKTLVSYFSMTPSSSSNAYSSARVKEFHNVLRNFPHLASRRPEVFVEACKSLLKMDFTAITRRGEDDENRLLVTVPNTTPSPSPPMEPLCEDELDCLYYLLNFVVCLCLPKTNEDVEEGRPRRSVDEQGGGLQADCRANKVLPGLRAPGHGILAQEERVQRCRVRPGERLHVPGVRDGQAAFPARRGGRGRRGGCQVPRARGCRSREGHDRFDRGREPQPGRPGGGRGGDQGRPGPRDGVARR